MHAKLYRNISTSDDNYGPESYQSGPALTFAFVYVISACLSARVVAQIACMCMHMTTITLYVQNLTLSSL